MHFKTVEYQVAIKERHKYKIHWRFIAKWITLKERSSVDFSSVDDCWRFCYQLHVGLCINLRNIFDFETSKSQQRVSINLLGEEVSIEIGSYKCAVEHSSIEPYEPGCKRVLNILWYSLRTSESILWSAQKYQRSPEKKNKNFKQI